ncbi:DUF1318 domain-containing protein [Candidatus Omnitrophota bacterium]
MKLITVLLLMVVVGLGCASMQVGGTKEPIKVDISMRLDIYQHVEQDIDAIESIVSGAQEKKAPADDQSFLRFFLTNAYAQGGLSSAVEQAALRRRDRLSQLAALESKAVVGENKQGLVEIRNAQAADGAVSQMVSAENSDRMLIYREVAKKNGTSVNEVQKLYAKRLQADAPSGTPIEVLNQASGAYQWQLK